MFTFQIFFGENTVAEHYSFPLLNPAKVQELPDLLRHIYE